MKSAIEKAFANARENGGTALVPYLTGGFPDISTCVDLVQTLADNGADVIEVGLPFSDPLADGPVIQHASRMALDTGVTTLEVFHIISKAKKVVSIPLVIMTYCNPVLRMGAGEFASRAQQAGVAGLIIPDLPPEEADEWLEAAEKHHLDTIFLVAPTTPPERIKLVASLSGGFLYYVSVTGVTGSGSSISTAMLEKIQLVRTLSPVPVAVGFGISKADQAVSLAQVADGVIVGSAFIREIQKYQLRDDQIVAVARLAADLSTALKSNAKAAQRDANA